MHRSGIDAIGWNNTSRDGRRSAVLYGKKSTYFARAFFRALLQFSRIIVFAFLASVPTESAPIVGRWSPHEKLARRRRSRS